MPAIPDGKIPFGGRVLLLGCGSVSRCLQPLLLRHLDLASPDRLTIMDFEDLRDRIPGTLAAGVRYVQEQGLERIHAHEVELVERLWRRLDEIGGYEVFGHRDGARRVGTLSFRSPALSALELGGILDQSFDIAVRPGLHCAPYVHRALGTFPDGTVRVSPGPFNTADEIDHLARALQEVAL